MLLEVLRLAASDGDVSAWGRTQGEEGETDSQHLSPSSVCSETPDFWRNRSEMCVRSGGAPSVLSHCSPLECVQAAGVPR